MSITVSESDIRGALRADSSEYPDSSLAFEKSLAESVVNDDLAPHAAPGDADRLELVGALLAAAYVEGDGDVTQLRQGNRAISFDTDDALSLWRKATQLDPTGQLSKLEKPVARIDVPDGRGMDG
ncbi:hypothetical protein [Halomarina litorea]|uniref:hypothetical protein n=1 Tax=Halomarina litorea TaxID=2961595 RepID=UPI0020C43914|nr:hypothetical protein [Halomarina sp. BCD28]